MGDTPQPACPGCGKAGLRITTEESAIPHFGEVVISTLICSQCGFRSTDVLPVEERTPARFRATISREEDLLIRVIRSSTSTIMIPELGVTIQPGSAHEGYISNVEGVLQRVLGILEQVKRDLKERSQELTDARERLKKAEDLSRRIERATNGNISEDGHFTIIIEDPQGNSALVDDNGKVQNEELTEEEILSLMTSLYR